MNSDYAWFPTADPISDTPSRELPHDIASVARLWVSTVYDGLRRAGPDRATQVRWILDRYIVPCFAPQTDWVGDITYFMVHAWLLRLVGRQHSELDDAQPTDALLELTDPGTLRVDCELSLRQAARTGGVSISTARRLVRGCSA